MGRKAGGWVVTNSDFVTAWKKLSLPETMSENSGEMASVQWMSMVQPLQKKYSTQD